jgi:dTMP kinase
MNGRLVTFEGVEGCGKSTQAALLRQRLEAQGRDVTLTREPGGTRLGEAVRRILQNEACGEPLDAAAEALLFAACRAQLVARVIRPALEAGRIVLCDRYGDSTVVYQGVARGEPREAMERLNVLATGALAPDVTVLLDMPAADGAARVAVRNAAEGRGADRFEREALAFHERVREGYLALAARDPGRVRVVDAAGPVDAVAARVWAAVAPALEPGT